MNADNISFVIGETCIGYCKKVVCTIGSLTSSLQEVWDGSDF